MVMIDFLVKCFLLLFICMIVVLFLGLVIWGVWISVEILGRIHENKISPWIDSHFGESKE